MDSIHRPLRRRGFLKIVGGATGLALIGPVERLLGLNEAWATGTGFPISGTTASKVLREAQSLGAEFSELYLERRIGTRMDLSGGQVESVEQGIFAGCGVRAVNGDRTGYAFADSFEPAELMEAARNAAAIASSPTDIGSSLIFNVERPNRRIKYLQPFDQVEQDVRVGWLRAADEAARAYDPAVQQVTIQHNDEMLEFAVINSDGLWMEDKLPLLYNRINVVAKKNGSTGTGFKRISYRLGAEQMDGTAPADAARDAARQALVMSRAEPAPVGEMPVILGKGGGVMFHEAVGHGLEGDFAHRGTSIYTGRIGEMVASPRVSIVDDGTLPETSWVVQHRRRRIIPEDEYPDREGKPPRVHDRSDHRAGARHDPNRKRSSPVVPASADGSDDQHLSL